MESETKKLLEILEAVYSEKIDVEEGEARVGELSMKEFQNLYGNLHHYWLDEDTREKEPEYKEFQKIELEKVIQHLRSGNIVAANKVSFLHVS